MAFDISKFFLKSKGIQGALSVILVTVLPLVGVNFTENDAQLISDTWDKVLVAGSAVYALYGRWVAKEKIGV